MIEAMVGYGRHHSKHTLMILAGYAVYTLDRNPLHYHTVSSGKRY